MQSREDAPRSRRLASPRGGRRPKRISKPSVSAFFTGPEELKDTAHSAALLAQLKSFYDARLLCDVTIEVVTPGSGPGTGRLFSCNRNVLAAACPYFKSMFTGGMYESQQASVTIHDVDAESFEVLVDYCYTGRVSLSEANVQRLYAASDMLQLEYVREACASFLARRLDLTNCTAILKFADAFDHHKLRSQAQSFIAHNFKQLSRMGSIREETLADLTLAQLLAVLRLDSLDVESEKTVCHVAVQWLEAAPKERGPSAAEVFKCIRWAHFPAEDQDYLEELLTKPIVKKYCLDVIKGALLQLSFDDGLPKALVRVPSSSSKSSSNNSNSNNNNDTNNTVVPAEENPPIDHDIYPTLQPRKGIWVYKPAPDNLHQLTDHLLWPKGMDVTDLNGYIYILGGQDPVTGAILKDVECYSVQKNKWQLVAQLPHSFTYFDLMAILCSLQYTFAM